MKAMTRNWEEQVFVLTALALLAFNLQHTYITISPELRLLSAWSVIVLILLAPGWTRTDILHRLGTACVAIPISLSATHPLVCVSAIGLTCSSLAVRLIPQARLTVLAIAAASLAAAIAVSSGILWFAEERFGRPLASAITSQSQYAEQVTVSSILGPWTFLAGGVLAAAAIQRNSLRLAVKRLALLVAGFAASFVASLLLLTWVPLAVATAAGTILLLRQTDSREEGLTAKGLALASVAAFLFALAAGLPFGVRDTSTRRVAFAPIGLGRAVLEQGPYAKSAVEFQAEFGAMVAMLEDQGWTVTRLNADWTGADLAGQDALIAINLVESPTREQRSAAEEFVRRGGTLLAAADHTDIMGVRKPFNELLSFTSIRISFDSAIPTDSGPQWHKGLWISGSLPATFDNSVATGISVGASLDIGHSARPLIVGVKGFSDRGDLANSPGFLGDMRYSPGERFSGIVLAAEERIDGGHVIAWGDTSTFQNTSIPHSSGVILDCLGTRRPAFSPTLVYLALAAFVVFIATTAATAGLLALIAITLLTVGYMSQRQAATEPAVTGKAAVYDTRFAPAYPGEFSEEKTSRFFSLFDRLSVPLYALDSVAAVTSRPRLIVVAAPTRVIPVSDASKLLQYVKEGGSLLVMLGEQHSGQGKELMRLLGLELRPEPLGGMATTVIESRPLAEAVSASLAAVPVPDQEPVNLHDSYEISGQSRVLVTTLGRQTAVAKELGAGLVTVIGDSRFFTDKQIGEKLTVKVGNARFLYEVIRSTVTANYR